MDPDKERNQQQRFFRATCWRKMSGWNDVWRLFITITIFIPQISCSHYWRRLGPVPSDMIIGTSCKSSMQCQLFMPHSHCEWDSRTCTCQPYHIQVNKTTCLPASLLGFGCSVSEQCSLKVPNSLCQDGVCKCHDNFVTYRKDKCLPPAKVDSYCLNDQQCTLGGPYTYCKYIIPRIYGKCRCPIGHVLRKGQCLPPLGKKCISDADCEAATSNSFCKLPSFRSTHREPVCACKSGFIMSTNSTNCQPVPTTPPPTTLAPASTTEASTSTAPIIFTEIIITDSSKRQPFVNVSMGTSDLTPVSLGKSCKNTLECQVRDPYSVCRDGICDCATPSSRCSSTNTGCHNDTFQCRSGQCISWYFVCDKNKNCEDGSDEENCNSSGCPKEAFQCNDGTCLPRGSVCNGRWECPDGSDEARCYNHIPCDEKSFRCKSGQCLPQYSFCNAVTDCVDGSDELDALCENAKTCPKGSFQCANNRCRSTAILCSGVDGCGDNSDEDRCEVCFCEKPMQRVKYHLT